MSIEEKAKYISGIDSHYSQNLLTVATITGHYNGFRTGAVWMLDKAVQWLRENNQNYSVWSDGEDMIKDFQKAMEE